MDIIDHYYHYLSQEMDGDLIVQEMASLQSPVLNENDIAFIRTAINQYQKNCYILEKVRVMDLAPLTTFCNLVECIYHERHLGLTLLKGKI